MIREHLPTKEKFREFVKRFMDVYRADEHGRYLSFDHSRRAFLDNHGKPEKYGETTLFLYSYLASWGMLRNSHLMQKDYLFNEPIVIKLDSEFFDLCSFDPFKKDNRKDAERIMAAAKSIESYCVGKEMFLEGKSKPTKIKSITDTNKSKTLLGTLGCTIAYDRYVLMGLGYCGITKRMGVNSIMEVCEFAKLYEDEIKEIISELGPSSRLYTPMKIVDTYFFELGFALERREVR